MVRVQVFRLSGALFLGAMIFLGLIVAAFRLMQRVDCESF